MELQLKHIAPYLPYGLKMEAKHSNLEYSIMTLCDKTGLSNIGISDVIDDIECFKPILRPLSDLWKDVYRDSIYQNEFQTANLILNEQLTLSDYNFLIENHFDVFGLIEKGLAIDINTVK